MLEKESILAIVVTYHPDRSFAERFERLAGQVGAVLIVDNNSGVEAVSMLREIASSPKVRLVLNSENRGIAAALNQGVWWAREKGYEWAVLLDQDTVPSENMLDTLSSVYEQFASKETIAIIGSNSRDSNSGGLLFPIDRDGSRSWQEVKNVITSGSLVSLTAYSTIGPFREEFFIDCVDWEYCLRARALGFRIILASEPLMKHAIGATSMHKLLWKITETSNHVPKRRYYMTRNHLVLAREYLLIEPAWVFSSLYTRLKSMVRMCLFEEDRLSKLKYVAMGVVDGLFCNFTRNLR